MRKQPTETGQSQTARALYHFHAAISMKNCLFVSVQFNAEKLNLRILREHEFHVYPVTRGKIFGSKN